MAILKIYTPIASEEQKECSMMFYGLDAVSFDDIDAFVASIPEDDPEIDLRLKCPGGSVSEGWAIVDKLRSTGKKITATIEGQTASMGTIILLAASVRRGAKHATMMIHAPYIPEYTLSNAYRAEDLEYLAEDLRKDTERIAAFYVERTGSDRETIDAQMKSAEVFGMERAKELGFISEIVEPKSAQMRRSSNPSAAGWKTLPKPKNMKENKAGDKTVLARAMAAIAVALGLDTPTPVVGYELNTESGEKLTIDKSEGEDPAVGDSASPDGEHKMPDGTTIVVVDGVITEIRDAEGEDPEGKDPEGDDAEARCKEKDEKIAQLEAQVTELSAKIKSTAEARILNAVAAAGGESWLRDAKSNYRPAQRNAQAGKTPKEGKEMRPSIIAQRLEAARKRNAEIED